MKVFGPAPSMRASNASRAAVTAPPGVFSPFALTRRRIAAPAAAGRNAAEGVPSRAWRAGHRDEHVVALLVFAVRPMPAPHMARRVRSGARPAATPRAAAPASPRAARRRSRRGGAHDRCSPFLGDARVLCAGEGGSPEAGRLAGSNLRARP